MLAPPPKGLSPPPTKILDSPLSRGPYMGGGRFNTGYLRNEDEALRHGGTDDHEHGDGNELHCDVVSERERQHQCHYTKDHHVINTHPDLLGIVQRRYLHLQVQ